MNGALPCRVIKVGGSLLDLSDLADRLRVWLSTQSAARHLLLVGGGPLVDVIRRWDAGGSLGVEVAHRLAISLLEVTAELLGSQLPELNRFRALEELASPDWSAALFVPVEFLLAVEPALDGVRLPSGWQVTSDSIAARLAQCSGADELVLLKSAPPPPAGRSLEQLAADGYVDAFFPRVARGLRRIRFENLRSP